MEITATPEEEDFRAELRAWLVGVMPEVWGSDRPPLGQTEDAEYEMRRRFDRALYRDGWAGLTWKREYGGRGGTLTQQMIFAEEAADAGAPELFNRGGIGVIGPTLIAAATEEQRRRHLSRILACEEIWCQGFSEPDAGSDLAGLRTRAVETDGGWLVRGQKIWTTLGQFADFCFLLARTSDEDRKHRGLTTFAVPMHQPGITVRPIRQMVGDQEFSEIFFEDAFVPADHVIGDIGDGWKVAMLTLGFERSTHFVARQVKLGREVASLVERVGCSLERVPAHLLTEVSEICVRSEALKWTVWNHIARLDAGGEPGPPDSASKVYWSDIWQRLTSVAVDIEAALGSAIDLPSRGSDDWSAKYLSSRAATIFAGTSEIQKNIISERGLGLPRE